MAKKQVQLDEKGFRKFGIRDKLAYAAGDAGCNLSFGLKNTVQTFWLVFMMMETGLFSILLLLVQAWDAINDPLIGSLIDSDKIQAGQVQDLYPHRRLRSAHRRRGRIPPLPQCKHRGQGYALYRGLRSLGCGLYHR